MNDEYTVLWVNLMSFLFVFNRLLWRMVVHKTGVSLSTAQATMPRRHRRH